MWEKNILGRRNCKDNNPEARDIGKKRIEISVSRVQ
jgi:hypothetical protein